MIVKTSNINDIKVNHGVYHLTFKKQINNR